MRKWLLALGVIASGALAFGSASCRTTGGAASRPSDAVSSPAAESVAAVDPNFCKDAPPGRCLSLYMLIPDKEMTSDLGLSMLSFAAQTGKFRPFVDAACRDGWGKFWTENVKAQVPPRPLRQALTAKVENFRCVIVPLKGFAEDGFKPTVAPGELALVVRLTKFDIATTQSAGQANLLVFKAGGTQALASYRSVFLGSGSAVSGGGYEVLSGLGYDNRKTSGNFASDVKVSVDWTALKRDLAKIDTSKPAATQTAALAAFFGAAKAAVDSGQPVGAAIVLIGLGYQAYKTVCSAGSTAAADQDLCTYAASTTMRTSEISAGLGAPTSTDMETLRGAIITSTTAILNDIFYAGDGRQIRRLYKL